MGEGRRKRQRYSAEFRQQVLSECARPGASMAAVALAHGLNANLVQKRRRQAHGDDRDRPLPAARFVPVAVAAAEPADAMSPAAIHLDVRRGAVHARIRWPVSAAGDCAAWLRDWLR
ncbi:MAG: transposase [Burkholderiales bacterium]|nr:transposase [Burkholderiales bacterium]